MAVKPNGKLVHIREQIIDDPASGLLLMFSAYPVVEGDPVSARLRICGDALPYGNRDFLFHQNGEAGGGGTAAGGVCEATWLREVVDETNDVAGCPEAEPEEASVAETKDFFGDDWEAEVTAALRREMVVVPCSEPALCHHSGCSSRADLHRPVAVP